MSETPNPDYSKLSKAELRALMPLPSETLRTIQQQIRSSGRCGSLQTGDGLPCMRLPRFGWTVCAKHGERAPQTAAKAERLLAVARMPAIEWLVDALEQACAELCESCGFPRHGLKEKRRLDTIAFKLLDRTGFGPHSKIDFNVTTTQQGTEVPLENWNEEERAELRVLLGEVRKLKDRVSYRLASDVGREARDVVDGVVVRPALPEGGVT